MSKPAYESIPLEKFQEVFKDTSTGKSLGNSYHLRSVANDVVELRHIVPRGILGSSGWKDRLLLRRILCRC
jgi:hypothetical protein